MSRARRIQSGRVVFQPEVRPAAYASMLPSRSLPQQCRIRALQIRNHSARDKQLRQSSERKMPHHHRGNRDVKGVRSIQRSAACVLEKQRLNSQLACGKKRCNIDGCITCQPGRHNPATRT